MARLGPTHGVCAVPAVGSRGAAVGSGGRLEPRRGAQGLRLHSPRAGREPRANILRTFGKSLIAREGRAAGGSCSGAIPPTQVQWDEPQPPVPQFPPGAPARPLGTAESPPVANQLEQDGVPAQVGPQISTSHRRAQRGGQQGHQCPQLWGTGGPQHVPCRNRVKSQASLARFGAKSALFGARGPQGRLRPEATCRPGHPWDAPGSSRGPARPLQPCPGSAAPAPSPARGLGYN